MRTLRILLLCFALIAVCSAAGRILAVDDPSSLDGIAVSTLFPGARFDPDIPTQEAFLGVRPGARPLRHGELMAYLEALAEVSPRAALQTYATTHESSVFHRHL